MSFPDISTEAFSVRSKQTNDALHVRLLGSLDMETSPLLDELLEKMLHQALKSGEPRITQFEFDCRELYLMSSSAISCFAKWLKRMKHGGVRVHVAFVTNANLSWQQRTFDSLRRIADALVVIESVPP